MFSLHPDVHRGLLLIWLQTHLTSQEHRKRPGFDCICWFIRKKYYCSPTAVSGHYHEEENQGVKDLRYCCWYTKWSHTGERGKGREYTYAHTYSAHRLHWNVITCLFRRHWEKLQPIHLMLRDGCAVKNQILTGSREAKKDYHWKTIKRVLTSAQKILYSKYIFRLYSRSKFFKKILFLISQLISSCFNISPALQICIMWMFVYETPMTRLISNPGTWQLVTTPPRTTNL